MLSDLTPDGPTAMLNENVPLYVVISADPEVEPLDEVVARCGPEVELTGEVLDESATLDRAGAVPPDEEVVARNATK